jgi:CheY-like chemotaxis protein
MISSPNGGNQSKEEQMIQDMAVPTLHEALGSRESECGGYALTQPQRARRFSRDVSPFCALVVSSDEVLQQSLVETIAECGLRAFRAYTVGESRRILNRQGICLVVCDDRLIDGKYVDLLKVKGTSRPRAPVIVVSRTGDWPDYFQAMSAGAFDFLAYPPIPGELTRVVHLALEPRALGSFEDAETGHSQFWGGGKS